MLDSLKWVCQLARNYVLRFGMVYRKPHFSNACSNIFIMGLDRFISLIYSSKLSKRNCASTTSRKVAISIRDLAKSSSVANLRCQAFCSHVTLKTTELAPHVSTVIQVCIFKRHNVGRFDSLKRSCLFCFLHLTPPAQFALQNYSM